MVKLNQRLRFIVSTYYLTRNSFFSLNSGMNSSSSSTLSSLGPRHLPLLCFFYALAAPSSSFMRISLPSSCCPSAPSSSSVGLSNSNSSLSSASSPSSASLLNSYCSIRLKVPVLVYVSVSPSLLNLKSFNYQLLTGFEK
jgi:hypothetical protein